ncbi:CsbD family protein [Corynebacterium sp.]|uniref:CsbD family protein n=1 Tax=Corynebacterium sp. TaxID=1720 RepID=UPI0019CB0C09|nr:CsbD family protein [Corynebacterium sp.]HHU67839.1 CsbD family protein [Corynebacterium sp.]
MSIGDKAEKLGGKIKEGVGKLTDNERLEHEGKADQTKADVKEAAEEAGKNVKEAGDRVLGSVQDAKRDDR